MAADWKGAHSKVQQVNEGHELHASSEFGESSKGRLDGCIQVGYGVVSLEQPPYMKEGFYVFMAWRIGGGCNGALRLKRVKREDNVKKGVHDL